MGDTNVYVYSSDNPIMYLDYDGASSVSVLNQLFIDYMIHHDSARIYRQLWGINSSNLYLSLHEMAQIIAADRLMKTGKYHAIRLEEAILNEEGHYYEADIMCYCTSGVEIYEIKPYGVSGIGQINKYIRANRDCFKKGEQTVSIQNVRLHSELTMSVKNSTKHKCVLWYSTHNQNDPVRVPNKEAIRILRTALGTLALAWLWGNDSTGIGAVDNAFIPFVMSWIDSD